MYFIKFFIHLPIFKNSEALLYVYFRTCKWICKQTTQFLFKSMAAYYVIAHTDLLFTVKKGSQIMTNDPSITECTCACHDNSLRLRAGFPWHMSPILLALTLNQLVVKLTRLAGWHHLTQNFIIRKIYMLSLNIRNFSWLNHSFVAQCHVANAAVN